MRVKKINVSKTVAAAFNTFKFWYVLYTTFYSSNVSIAQLFSVDNGHFTQNAYNLLKFYERSCNMIKLNIRKYDIFKLYYWHNATLVGRYRLPQLMPTQAIPHDVISFNERSGIRNPEKHWLDFFIDDEHFESFWNRPEVSFKKLRKFEGIITTDYSMLPEMLPGQIIWNCTRNRIMAYYLQVNGFNIIPVASWCSENDYEWCFDGLPEKSSIAITTNGCLSSLYGKRIFLSGVEALQQRKQPSHIIVCGRKIEELDKYSNIVYYPCFSQRMKERIG